MSAEPMSDETVAALRRLLISDAVPGERWCRLCGEPLDEFGDHEDDKIDDGDDDPCWSLVGRVLDAIRSEYDESPRCFWSDEPLFVAALRGLLLRLPESGQP